MRAVKHPKTIILLVVLLCGLAYSYSWTYTPRGRLDYPVAVSLRLLSFPYRLKPNPDHDLTVTVPANLAFMVDLVLPAVEVGDTRDMDIPGQEA